MVVKGLAKVLVKNPAKMAAKLHANPPARKHLNLVVGASGQELLSMFGIWRSKNM
jgi:hypothetical protein